MDRCRKGRHRNGADSEARCRSRQVRLADSDWKPCVRLGTRPHHAAHVGRHRRTIGIGGDDGPRREGAVSTNLDPGHRELTSPREGRDQHRKDHCAQPENSASRSADNAAPSRSVATSASDAASRAARCRIHAVLQIHPLQHAGAPGEPLAPYGDVLQTGGVDLRLTDAIDGLDREKGERQLGLPIEG